MNSVADDNDTQVLIEAVDAMAKGDLQNDLVGVGPLWDALRRLQTNLQATFSGSLDNCVRISVQTNEGSIATAGILGATREIDQETQSIAAAIEEMVTSVNQISETSQSAATDAEQVRDIVARNEQAVSDAVRSMGEAAKSVSATMAQAESLNAASEEIGSIVDTIDAIAKQTNLLALNATIEAARAGEAGKGFAVVAGEVKNLSQQTARATDEIRTRIEDLRRELSSIVTMMQSGAAVVEDGKTMVDQLGNEMQGMGQRVGGVTDRMAEIASILDQQTKASDEVSAGVTTISTKITDNVSAVGGLADIMDNALSAITDQLTTLSDIDVPNKVIKLAKSDHVIWKKKLADMAVGRQSLAADELADHHSCRLGKWYYGDGALPYRSQNAYRDLEPPHERVHQAGKAAARKFADGDIQGALSEIAKVELASKEVLAHLDTLDQQSA